MRKKRMRRKWNQQKKSSAKEGPVQTNDAAWLDFGLGLRIAWLIWETNKTETKGSKKEDFSQAEETQAVQVSKTRKKTFQRMENNRVPCLINNEIGGLTYF